MEMHWSRSVGTLLDKRPIDFSVSDSNVLNDMAPVLAAEASRE